MYVTEITTALTVRMKRKIFAVIENVSPDSTGGSEFLLVTDKVNGTLVSIQETFLDLLVFY